MKVFNDPPGGGPNYWPAARLGDVFKVARLFERSGMRHVVALPGSLALAFIDPVINANVRLDIMPWGDGGKGWWWDAFVVPPNGEFVISALGARWLTNAPLPSQVRRAYFRLVRNERQPIRRKRR